MTTAYHMSAKRFDRFKQQEARRAHSHPDVGFHFGTKKTALIAGNKLEKEGRVSPGDLVYLYKANLDLGNTLRLEENRRGSWSVFDILRAIFDPFEAGGELPPQFSEDDFFAFYDDEVIAPSGENVLDLMHDNRELTHEFIAWLHARGVDSISYNNTYEGGGKSYIVLSPDQIEILDVTTYEVA